MMKEPTCPICIESLQYPDENRGGIQVLQCGHPFHTNCIIEGVQKQVSNCYYYFEILQRSNNLHIIYSDIIYCSNLNCPICRKVIRLFYMNPLFLPDRVAIHNHIYNRLRVARNDSSQFNFDRARLMIYRDEANGIPLNITRPNDYDEVVLYVAPRR